MDAKICDRCGKVVAVQNAWHSRLGADYYFYLCEDCFADFEKFIRGERQWLKF